MIHEVVVLKRSDGGSFHDVSIDSDPDRAHIPFIQDYPGDGRDAALYRVCSRNADGNDACQLGPDFYVTFAHDPCATGGGGAGGGGVSGRQCGPTGHCGADPIRMNRQNRPARPRPTAARGHARTRRALQPPRPQPRPAPPDATLDRGVGAPARDVGLAGRAERIACPTLVCSAERDEIGVTARKLFDALTCEKEFARW